MDIIDSLYIHFPFCRHLCNYCDFYKSAPSTIDRSKKIIEFQKTLGESFSCLNKLLQENKVQWSALDTLYIGGGTPSLWGLEGAQFLENFLKTNKLTLKKGHESTMEVNPGTWTEEGLNAFLEFGINRFSLGVQSTKNEFLEKLDRVHRMNEVKETLSKFNSIGANFSVDFMLGLPFSNEYKRDIISELDEILSYNPNHLSLYILTVKDNYRFYNQLPDDDFTAEEYLKVSEYLQKKGYLHYEVSNFCLPGKESRHNSKYWDGTSIAALGPSATGYLANPRLRYKWKTLEPAFDVESLTLAEEKMESFYLKFRTSKGVNLDSYFKDSDLETAHLLAKKWEKNDLCSIDEEKVTLSPKGYLLMDSLMDEVFMSTKSI